MSYFGAGRAGWGQGMYKDGIGGAYKDSITEPGPWFVSMGMQGETIPKLENHVRLSPDQQDEWGVPQLITSIAYDDNDDKMAADFITQGSEMLEAAGCRNINGGNNHQNPGLDIHEVGGVRMGKDPKTSLLNEWNQLHACKNVFVTDGACMTSTGNQNPSLTFMALTARAANHAVEELKKQNL
jgi:choline dehydrogenase-like flavoprotein